MSIDFAANPGQDEQDVFFSKLRDIVQGHESTLGDIEQTFNDNWDATTWDLFTDTITVDLGGSNNKTTIADTLGRSKLHNRLFFRIVLALSAMTHEMQSLTDEMIDHMIPPLSMFGDPDVDSDGYTDEQAQRGLARMLPFLMDVWNWFARVKKVVAHIMRHFASLYDEKQARTNYGPYQAVNFPIVWHALTDLIGALVQVEEVFFQHDTLRQGLHVYRRMLATMAKNPAKYEGADEFQIEQTGKLLNKLDGDLLDDTMLRMCVAQMFDTEDIRVTNNSVFFNEFTSMLSMIIATLQGSLGTTREASARSKYIGACGLFVLYFNTFQNALKQDTTLLKRIIKDLFELHRKAPVIYLSGLFVFKPAQWLARRVPNALGLVIKDPVKEGMASIKVECGRAASEFHGHINHLTTITTVWVAQMESSFPSDRPHAKQHVRTLTQLLQRGAQFAQEINRIMRNIIFVHQAADLSLTLPIVDGIARCIELLMMIRAAYHAKSSTIIAMYALVIQSLAYTMQKSLFTLHLKLKDVLQTSSEAVTDQHSAIGQALALLNNPLTPQALTTLDVVLSIAFLRRDCAVTPKEYEEIIATFTQLVRVAAFQKNVRSATDCEFLYWQRESFIPLFLERLYERPIGSEYALYLFHALHDCCGAILSSKHVEDANTLLDAYEKFVRNSITEKIVNPLCIDIENDLRLYTHSAVLGSPFKRIERSAKDLSRFTRLAPFRLFSQRMHIAAQVEDYLDEQFYNLNALHANDWKTYEEMRTLAHERFGLQLAEGFLPGSIVDQGLDVLVITKNIHVFVANYTYNLNEQLFVQRPSQTESKHLHTLHIRHIANSIRTHGTGIMNTTVNYVYKSLLKKLAILSQFLYDDHVKSRLLKDIKHFNQNKTELKGFLPIARAEKFSNDIRKLGVTEDGQTYLDQFRQLVSEIGNALGYMRMVRSGGLRAIAEAAVYVPELDNIPHLEKCVNPKAVREGEEPDDEIDDIDPDADEDDEDDDDDAPRVAPCTEAAIRNVDSVVHNMSKRLAQGSDYFRMLEEAISKKLADEEKYGHLKNFYMIVPALCLSHIEHMVHQKEQLMKKNKEGLFTDDGFALGVVFLLSLFRVLENFESLHWFESVREHYTSRKRAMTDGIASKKAQKGPVSGEDELKTMALTLTMVDSSLREYEALEFCFTASRVFFQHRTPDEAEGEEETDDEGGEEAE